MPTDMETKNEKNARLLYQTYAFDRPCEAVQFALMCGAWL